MSVFYLKNQNSSLDKKIVAGLERLSQAFRVLLWEKAKEQGVSPIQIQLLIFICYHSAEKSTISYLSREFNLTKPTISDAIKILEQKKLIKKYADSSDTRSYTIQLTVKGRKIVSSTESFTDPITEIISKSSPKDKLILWGNITNLISTLTNTEVISVQRICFNCKHYSKNGKTDFCNLLGQQLKTQDIRIDCEEFELLETA